MQRLAAARAESASAQGHLQTASAALDLHSASVSACRTAVKEARRQLRRQEAALARAKKDRRRAQKVLDRGIVLARLAAHAAERAQLKLDAAQSPEPRPQEPEAERTLGVTGSTSQATPPAAPDEAAEPRRSATPVTRPRRTTATTSRTRRQETAAVAPTPPPGAAIGEHGLDGAGSDDGSRAAAPTRSRRPGSGATPRRPRTATPAASDVTEFPPTRTPATPRRTRRAADRPGAGQQPPT